MLSALYAIARPSVRLSVTRVDQSKTEVRIIQFSPYGSPIPLFVGGGVGGQISSTNYERVPTEWRCQKKVGGEKLFSSFMCQYLKMVRDTPIVTIND